MYCVAQKYHTMNYHNRSEEVAGNKHNHHNMNMKVCCRAARLRAMEQGLLETTYLESK